MADSVSIVHHDQPAELATIASKTIANILYDEGTENLICCGCERRIANQYPDSAQNVRTRQFALVVVTTLSRETKKLINEKTLKVRQGLNLMKFECSSDCLIA